MPIHEIHPEAIRRGGNSFREAALRVPRCCCYRSREDTGSRECTEARGQGWEDGGRIPLTRRLRLGAHGRGGAWEAAGGLAPLRLAISCPKVGVARKDSSQRSFSSLAASLNPLRTA